MALNILKYVKNTITLYTFMRIDLNLNCFGPRDWTNFENSLGLFVSSDSISTAKPML